VEIATPLQNRAIPRFGRAHGDPTNLEQIVLANDSVQTEENDYSYRDRTDRPVQHVEIQKLILTARLFQHLFFYLCAEDCYCAIY
jgi:hypothetical protein